MSSTITPEVKAQIIDEFNKFNQYLTQGLTGIVKAGEIFCRVVDKYPGARKVFMDSRPGLSRPFWDLIEKCGRGEVNPALLLDNSFGASRLRRLPVHEQNKAVKNDGVLVLKDDGTSVRVPVAKLTRYQAELVFARDHVRTIEAQKVELSVRAEKRRKDAAARKAAEKAAEAEAVKAPYVEDGVLIVSGPARFTQKDLLNFLWQMQ